MTATQQTPPPAIWQATLPQGWHALTPAEGRYVCRLAACGRFAPVEIRARFLARHLRRAKPAKEGGQGGANAAPAAVSAAEAVQRLAWLDTPPAFPVLFAPEGARRVINPTLAGVPFADYLRLTNLYRAALAAYDGTSVESASAKAAPALRAIRRIAYRPRPSWRAIARGGTPSPAECYALLLWLASWHKWAAARWPELFTAAMGSAAPALSPEAVMDAQIRALTGGDITKEEEILRADTFRALSELNAKAREARESREAVEAARKR